MIPTVGRIVLYTLSDQDADAINRRRTNGKKSDIESPIGGAPRIAAWPTGAQAHIGNEVKAGDVFPMLIVRIWGSTPESAVNGQVFLDGNDAYWATLRTCGDYFGGWQWPTIQK